MANIVARESTLLSQEMTHGASAQESNKKAVKYLRLMKRPWVDVETGESVNLRHCPERDMMLWVTGCLFGKIEAAIEGMRLLLLLLYTIYPEYSKCLFTQCQLRYNPIGCMHT